MKFKELLVESSKGLNIEQLEKIYSNIDNPYDDMPKKISGIEYSKLEDVDVEPNTTFYALNANGKRITYKSKTSIRAKKVIIDGKDYIVTNKLSYPGKKWIKEIMIARG